MADSAEAGIGLEANLRLKTEAIHGGFGEAEQLLCILPSV